MGNNGVVEMGLEITDQIFSYWMGDELLHFNVSLLHRLRKLAPWMFRMVEIPLSQQVYDLCMEHRGIEEPRVERLSGKHLREPGYIVLWNLDREIPDYTVVDGHHRIVRRFRGGVRTMSFWACPEEVWRQVLMPSTKEEDEYIATQMPPKVVEPVGFFHEVTSRKRSRADGED